MQWNRSNAIGMAKPACTYCHGVGMRVIRKDKEVPCNCVFRSIFRACLNRFRQCVATAGHSSTVTLDLCQGLDGRRSYGRKKEEYIADFCLVSKRFLDAEEHRVFRYHFLLGADWKLCVRQLKMDRGNFFHCIYRIEQKLGRAFAELKPYGLYPLDEYFGVVLPDRDEQPLRRSYTAHLPLSA